MPTTAIHLPAPAGHEPTVIPSTVLDNLATRFRPGGVFMVLARPDGTILYHDAAAEAFFQRYALPLLQSPPWQAESATEKIRTINGQSNVSVWSVDAGLTVAAVPYCERRQLVGVLLLAAKSPSYKLGEDVVRTCGRLGLDGIWLNQQAEGLPAYSEEALQRQARLLLSVMRDQVRLTGLEVELDSLSGQLANTYEELSLIYQISSGMKVNRRAPEFFKQACLDVMEVMCVRGMGVALQNDSHSKHEPVLYGQIALPEAQLRKLSDLLMRELSVRKAPLLINELSKDKTFGWLGAHAQQMLAVPLQRQEEVLGCLFAIDKSVSEFDSVDSKLLNSIANESAIYLENARLFNDVHGLMMGLLHSLTSAVDAKDAYTCGHSERVAMLSKTLAQEAKLSDHAAERIYMAGLLHDVGKIGVPESVLQKTGRLTPEEFEEMKKHPQIGARILRDIRQIEDIIPGVLHHHERYDGKGYPASLAGENIPVMGRIICLADCFDAMTSNRTYRKGMPIEVALAEIRRCGGTQFDPALAEAFLRLGRERLLGMLHEHQERSKKLVDLQETLRGT